MGGSWFPEPPQETEDRLGAPSQIVIVDDEGSDDEGLAPAGYELLSQSLNGLSSEDEDESDDEGPTPTVDVAQQPSDQQARMQSELNELDTLYTSTARTDININCDEIRAAMADFSLPSSSIPPWASNIPESQWTSVLAQQLQRIQSDPAPRSS